MAGVTGRKKATAGAELQGLPKRLSDRITELKLSERQLSKASGVAQPVINRLCHGDRLGGVTAETVIRLAKALDMPVAELLCGVPETRSSRAAPAAPVAVPPTQIVVMVQPGSPAATAEALAQAAQHIASLQAPAGHQSSSTAAPVKRPHQRRH